jgi:flagellar motility protein MotE (MotC chaperone)
MPRLPKYPKGLKASIARLERKEAQKKKVLERKKEIERLKAKKAALQKKVRGY